MARYHIAKSGKPAVCRAASEQSCPRGGKHFANKETADYYLETIAEEKAAAERVRPKHSSQEVLDRIPKAERVNITAAELDDVYEVMRDFGTQRDDSWGFRHHIASKASGHWEWSERGAGARYTQTVGIDGRIREARLYSISDYDNDDARFYLGQARIRKALGLPEYTERESEVIAESYWDGHLLGTYGDVSLENAKKIRARYVQDIIDQGYTGKVAEAWQEEPNDQPANLPVYAALKTEGATETQKKVMAAIEAKDKRAFNRALDGDSWLRRFRSSEISTMKKAAKDFFKD